MHPKRKKIYIYIYSDFSCSPACIFSMLKLGGSYTIEEEEDIILLNTNSRKLTCHGTATGYEVLDF